jgi:hypothetical protein
MRASTPVGYAMAMRLHITLDDDLVAELDRRVGPRQRSGYIAAAVRRALSDAHRWELVESSIGASPPSALSAVPGTHGTVTLDAGYALSGARLHGASVDGRSVPRHHCPHRHFTWSPSNGREAAPFAHRR